MRALGLVIALALLLVGTATAKTIVGKNPRGERIVGTRGPDVIRGGPGPDRIFGLAGSDRISVEYGGRDRISCGPGLDLVTADATDAIASDCELVSRRVSRDLTRDVRAQHESEVEPDSFTVGHTTVATFQVGRFADGGAAAIGYAVSSDDGRTWRNGVLPGLTQTGSPPGSAARASDPAVAYDALHGVWLITTLVLDGQATRLTISRSSDGFTWSTPIVAAEASSSANITFDKEWVACDNGRSSPFAGRCYLAYSDVLHGDVIASKWSTDGGLTWSGQVQVSSTDGVGVIPVVRPSGDLVLVYLAHDSRIESAVSTDGAVSFSAPVVVSPVSIHPERGLRFSPLPSADVDASGRVWATWHDCRFSPACTGNSAVVTTSQDGRTWSAPTVATSGRDAVQPSLGIDPASGLAAIAYYAIRATGIDCELVVQRPGGAGWGAPRRLSAQTMAVPWLPSTASGRMLGDYISLTWSGPRPLVVWALASPPQGSSLRQAIYATRG
jgi:RTX calcium-binding nonapeptide repeat (4 copies)